MHHASPVASCLVLALAGSLLAQTPGVTAPKGFNDRPGSSFTFTLGMIDIGHQQYGEGTLRGSQLAIGRVSYRLDEGRYYDAIGGMGRSWTKVTLTMGYTDVDQMTTTFSTNVLSKTGGAPADATVVYDAKASWPTISGTVSKASFGQHVDFPLKSLFVYQGQKHDLLMDYRFQGGTLSNSGSWTSVGRNYLPYYMDALQHRSSVNVQGIHVPASSSCNDSAHSNPSPAQTNLAIDVYSDWYQFLALQGKSALTVETLYTAPSAPVVTAIAFAGTATGINVGAACNNLHANLSGAWLPLFQNAGSGNASAKTVTPPIPYNDAVAGLTMWAQSAWSDSRTGAFSLTNATYMMLPTKPASWRKRMVFWRGSFPATGLLTGTSEYQSLPLFKAN